MDFFISDTHFSHKNIVSGCSDWDDISHCRQFSSLDEHDGTIVENINSVVGESDVLWHLGDWSFGHVSNVAKFRNLIRCKNVALIFGNHDQKIRDSEELQNLFEWTGDFRTMFVGHGKYKQQVVMCHYALQVWENNHRGAIMLHGHSHNHLNHDTDGKILDVCPEGHDNKPWSYDQVMEYMDSR